MDNSPSGLFDSYEQDFQHIIESVRDKLEGNGKDEQGGQLISLLPATLFMGAHSRCRG